MVTRRGASNAGCLVGLIVLGIVLYFGFNVGRVYWRYYQYRDDMAQQARFADHFSDHQITAALTAQADSLGLPDDADNVVIQRQGTQVTIDADYSEHLALPFFARDVHFAPHVEVTF